MNLSEKSVENAMVKINNFRVDPLNIKPARLLVLQAARDVVFDEAVKAGIVADNQMTLTARNAVSMQIIRTIVDGGDNE